MDDEGGGMSKADIIKQHLKDYQHLETKTIARIILHNFGSFFDGDIEKIRRHLRYYRGTSGQYNREQATEIIPRSKTAMPLTHRRVKKPYHLSPGLWLVVNDPHIPFHEQLPIESMVTYAQVKKVTGILYNGDLQDCASISYWSSSIKRDFDAETSATIQFLDFMRYEFPKAEFVYKPANHEYRLPRLLQNMTPQLIGVPLAILETRLGLEQRGIELLEYKQTVMAGKLPILHGDEYRNLSRAVNPARGLYLRAKSWAACGHCHSTSENTEVDINGVYLTTWSFGCLCDLHPDFEPLSKWNWGFAIVNVEKNGDFTVVNKRILPSGEVV